MANFAVIDGTSVLNVIVADSKDIAEATSEKTCILLSDSDRAAPGGTYNPSTKKFIAPKPYPSWTLDEYENWVPPISMPSGEDLPDNQGYFWDEETESWIIITRTA